MENFASQQNVDDMDNIISINIPDAGEELDFDFDYDPNDMYYELNGYNS